MNVLPKWSLLCFACTVFLAMSISRSHAENGINFISGQDWQRVKALAKDRHKYIFVDCYATWCGPCKKMDRNIYSNSEIGSIVNERFVAVKIQMDTTSNDNEVVKNWYHCAREFTTLFKINSFPTYLIFSPDGNIVHKDVGYKDMNDFKKLLADGQDSSRQYYSLLAQNEKGDKDYSKYNYLMNLTAKFSDGGLFQTLSRDYLQNYLYKLDNSELYTSDRLYFIGDMIKASRDQGFSLFYSHEKEVDQILKEPGYAEKIVGTIILNEDIYPKLWDSVRELTAMPSWRRISRSIEQKYNSKYAEATLLDAKIEWYSKLKDWDNISRYKLDKLGRNFADGIDTSLVGIANANNILYLDVLMHCNDKKLLSKAIKIQKVILRLYPGIANFIDTYANLLYKSGKLKQARDWEHRACSLRPKDRGIGINYEKMIKGEPTWVN